MIPQGVAVNSLGLYVADTQDCRIVEVAAATGTQWGISMTVVAMRTSIMLPSPGSCGYSGRQQRWRRRPKLEPVEASIHFKVQQPFR